MPTTSHRLSPTGRFAVAIAVAVAAIATAQAAELQHTVVRADGVQWGPAPPFLPGGAKLAVLAGDPGKEGEFVIRLKFPAGYVVPPHRHSKSELVTVISGKLAVVAGEKVVRSAPKTQPPGTFVNLPAELPHYARAEVETVVQINGVGPFDITYIDSKDDPRNAAKVSSQ